MSQRDFTSIVLQLRSCVSLRSFDDDALLDDYVSRRLAALRDIDELILEQDLGHDSFKLYDVDGQVVFIGMFEQHSGIRKHSIGTCNMTFHLPNGLNFLTTNRNEYDTQVSSGDLTFGEIATDSCSRSFGGTLKLGHGRMDFIPTGCQSSPFLCCCNACCISKFRIVSNHGNLLGTIECAKKKTIKFEDGITLPQKALILAGALVIYELYFAPCCGNVGLLGSRQLYTAPFAICAIACFLYAVVPSVRHFVSYVWHFGFR